MSTPRAVSPRLLSAEQAAAYLGYASTGVLANIPVKPVQMAEKGPGSQPKYDRAALDAWLDRLSGLSVKPSSDAPANEDPQDPDAIYEQWKASRSPR